MKNLLKKIGVIGLTIAVLAPFIDLPKVEAAETEKYQQSYLFLDVGWNGLQYYLGQGDTGYTTYTTFPYDFVRRDGYETKVVSAEIVNQMSAQQLSSFNTDLSALSKSGNNEWRTQNTTGNYFNSVEGTKVRTALLHGYWSNTNEQGNKIEANWNIEGDPVNDVYQKTDVKDALKFTLAPARYDQSQFSQCDASDRELCKTFDSTTSGSSSNNAIVNYLQYIIDNYEDAENKGYVWEKGDKKYLNFMVNRSVSTTNIENKGLTYYATKYDDSGKDTGVVSCVYSESDSDISDSYKAYLNNKCQDSDEMKAKVTVGAANTFKTSVLYYWPAVLNVEYELIPTSNSSDNPAATPTKTGEWKLVYDANANGDSSVVNVPDSQTAKVNESIKVSSSTPTRAGFKFVEWCDKDGKKCYKAGDTITSDTEGVYTVYAKWQGTEGTTDNSKTGIASYIISFIAVGAIAGGIYYVSKKKNLFKQI